MGNSPAQPLIIPHTKTHRLESKINGVRYKLFVALPLGYQDSKNDYPVIFTTDPTFIFPILCGVAKSLYPLIPEAIIVGIGHDDLDFQELDVTTENVRREIYRTRDFLPNQQAESFKDFIGAEVIPLIDKTYRTKAGRTLIGHSYGGIFASWMSLNYPTFFQNYLVISPILDFKNGLIFSGISNQPETAAIKIYLCAGNLEANYSSNKNFLADLKKFYDQINSPPNVTAKLEIFEDEYHCTVVPFALSKGLRFLCQKPDSSEF